VAHLIEILCYKTTGTGTFPGVTRPECGNDTHPSSAEIKERVELYLYSPSVSWWPVLLLIFTFTFTALESGKSRVRFLVGFIEIFYWRNPAGRTTALGSTQPLTEISRTDISWEVKAVDACGWQPYRLRLPTVQKLWEPGCPGALRAYPGLYWNS